jgi:hypothetical protein
MTQRLLDDEPADAAGRADDQHGQGAGHPGVTSSTTRSPLRVRG